MILTTPRPSAGRFFALVGRLTSRSLSRYAKSCGTLLIGSTRQQICFDSLVNTSFGYLFHAEIAPIDGIVGAASGGHV
jgi:hypothetical protein